MTGVALCIAAFFISLYATRRSLSHGLGMLLANGYFYGILRANVPQTFSHFIFDAGVVGLFIAYYSQRRTFHDRVVASRLRSWMLLLIGWPLILLLIPVQDPLIQLVGFRGNTFFLPFLLIGASLTPARLRTVASWIAWLNVFAFAVAAAEFVVGLEPFFPRNAVTEIMYRSRDVAGMSAFRIPSTFTGAHAYAGSMVTGLPLLLGMLNDPEVPPARRLVCVVGIGCAIIGTLMAASRSHAAVLFLLAGTALLIGRMPASRRGFFLLILAATGFVASREVRLQRFTELEDTELVTERVSGSVNSNFLTLLQRYPMGNGLGGGGTSIPYFLQSRLRDAIGLENEYSRIMLEQGIPGLLFWVGFIVWVMRRGFRRREGPWAVAYRIGGIAVLTYFGTGLIGAGVLTSIPQSVLLLLLTGWVVTPTEVAAPASALALSLRQPPPDASLAHFDARG